jgi:protein-disulfide isomerase
VPLISGAAIVVGVLAVVALVIASGGFGGSSLPPVAAADGPPPPAELRDGRSLGDAAAPVQVDLYSDPQCPACGAFAARVEPLLVAGPVRDGTARLTYRDLAFLGPESLDAAIAMRVAEALGDRFWEYHDLVYANQHGEGRGAFSRDRLADMAEAVGLERAAFLDALGDPVHEEAVRAESARAGELGVDSTPTLIVNGEVIAGVPAWEDLRARIDAAAALAAATAAPAPTATTIPAAG